MKLVIHKGAREIGGTCIQLSDQGTTILLDLGLPLKKDSPPLRLECLLLETHFKKPAMWLEER